MGRQVQIHRQAVYESLKEYLKGEWSMTFLKLFQCLLWLLGVCQLYSEQRAMRVKRIVDSKRMYVLSHLLQMLTRVAGKKKKKNNV